MTSYLYHALGLEGYRHLRTDFRGGRVIYHVERAPGKRACGVCGASASYVKLDGRFERTFLGVPVGFKPQEIVLHGHLQACSWCQARVREPIPFADGKIVSKAISLGHARRHGRFDLDMEVLRPTQSWSPLPTLADSRVKRPRVHQGLFDQKSGSRSFSVTGGAKSCGSAACSGFQSGNIAP